MTYSDKIRLCRDLDFSTTQSATEIEEGPCARSQTEQHFQPSALRPDFEWLEAWRLDFRGLQLAALPRPKPPEVAAELHLSPARLSGLGFPSLHALMCRQRLGLRVEKTGRPLKAWLLWCRWGGVWHLPRTSLTELDISFSPLSGRVAGLDLSIRNATPRKLLPTCFIYQPKQRTTLCGCFVLLAVSFCSYADSIPKQKTRSRFDMCFMPWFIPRLDLSRLLFCLSV